MQCSPRKAVTGVDPRVAKHAREVHGFCTAQEYRRHVLGRAMASGPQPVTSQVLRTRLTAWKQSLTDAAFAQGVCACCARKRMQTDLLDVTFPPPTSAVPPA